MKTVSAPSLGLAADDGAKAFYHLITDDGVAVEGIAGFNNDDLTLAFSTKAVG